MRCLPRLNKFVSRIRELAAFVDVYVKFLILLQLPSRIAKQAEVMGLQTGSYSACLFVFREGAG